MTRLRQAASPGAARLLPTVLRTAEGEPPLGRNGETFHEGQGTVWHPEPAGSRSPSTTIGVLELEGGKWLAMPPGFHVAAQQHDSHEAALAAAVDAMIERAHRYTEAKEGTSWTPSFAARVIEWALSLKGERLTKRAESTPEEITSPAAISVQLDYGKPCEPTDPLIADLLAANNARKSYPAGHTVRHTNPVVNGVMVTLGACDCGVRFQYPWTFEGRAHRMPAAIEAHWQKFDYLADKVDGRGEPIKAEEGAGASTEPKRRAKRRSAPKTGDVPDLANAALPEPVSAPCQVADAGSTSSDPGAGGPRPASAPAPVASSAGAGNPFDEDDQRRFQVLLTIDARREVDGADVRDLVGVGYAHCGSTAVKVTDEGRAFLDAVRAANDEYLSVIESEASPIGEASNEVVGGFAGDCSATSCGENQPEAPGPVATDQHADANVPARTSSEASPIGEASIEVGEPSNKGAAAPGTCIDPAREALDCSDGSLASEAAEISATSTGDDDDDLEIAWPSYDTYLEDKIVVVPIRGIEVRRDALHPWLKDHCKDLEVWALRLGCAAIFANFGLHKTAMQLEWTRQLHNHVGGLTLNVLPLGVRHGFIGEAVKLDMDVRFVRTDAEVEQLAADGVVHFLTNYESIREGKLDPNAFGAVSLDEASVLRSYGSKTFQEFLPLFSKVPFKLVATATPSPNRYKELIHYAGFLGVMDTGLALTRWFQRNSEKAGDLTLYPHKEDEFWMWVHSWAAFLQKPSELGYSDDGYELPPLKLTWHEVPADHSKAEPDRNGQGLMFRPVAGSLQDAAKARRDSLPGRVAKMMEIINADPEAHRVIWHDLEAEREAIEQALPGVVSITGTGMDIDERERRLADFEEGRIRHFATKPILSGSGSNFQYHCHKAIYVALPGYGYKFNDFIQSLYRLQRFGQQHPVEVDIIFSEDERAGRDALIEKWALDTEMRRRMSEIIKRHGLDTLPLRDAMLRKIGCARVEVRGERFVCVNNDTVAECRTWPENSVDQIVTSIPFANQYEYSPSYNDFGHTDDTAHFWGQMDFATPEWLRILKPGRLACVHVKDRVLFGSVTGEGVPTISPFHAEAIMHYRAHGFQFMGMITVVTDVVRENNQTYRLGWSENAKDGTKMGVGCPEYILLLRKPQSDRSRSYADMPVEKSKEDYTRARWQIDAHGFWRSSGNRHLTPEEFAQCSAADLAKLFAKATVDAVYDHAAHVKIGETHERTGTLPATFMAIAPGSHHPDVWHDVNRMRTLNMSQARKGAEMHLCPLQFDIVDRLMDRFSNPGELILDPFGGLMTVPYRALLKGRRGAGIELNAGYFLDGVHYCRMAEEKATTPQLFDLVTFDKVNTPPLDRSGGS